MSLPLEFHRSVRDEIQTAYRWYESHRADLGRDFMDELDRVLRQIAESPERYGFSESDIREGAMSRFPHAVFYRVLDDRIRVLAVFHTSRDPSVWRSRR